MPKEHPPRYPGKAFPQTPNTFWPLRLNATFGAEPAEQCQADSAVLRAGKSPWRSDRQSTPLVANRGLAGRFDEWVRDRCGRLNREDRADSNFRKLEHDVDFDNELPWKGWPDPCAQGAFGSQGLPICSKQVEEAHWFRQGYPVLKDDQNGRWEDGVYSRRDRGQATIGERVPASIAYLTPVGRERPQSSVRTEAIAPDPSSSTGERYSGRTIPVETGKPKRCMTEETIVALGGIHSCALLMRAEIGSRSGGW